MKPTLRSLVLMLALVSTTGCAEVVAALAAVPTPAPSPAAAPAAPPAAAPVVAPAAAPVAPAARPAGGGTSLGAAGGAPVGQPGGTGGQPFIPDDVSPGEAPGSLVGSTGEQPTIPDDVNPGEVRPGTNLAPPMGPEACTAEKSDLDKDNGTAAMGAYNNQWLPRGWAAAYKSEAAVTAAIDNIKDLDWACFQKFYPGASTVWKRKRGL